MGWDEGVSTMKQGGKRTMLIPARLAYGDQNIGGGLIPPNSELKFECELVEVKSGPMAGVGMAVADKTGAITSALGLNPFTFFLVLLLSTFLVPAFLPDDNVLMQ